MVTVIIPNWNGMLYLPACLQSLSRQSHPSYQVVLVDNGSTDGSVDYVRREFPHIAIIQNAANVGFAAACNQGIRFGHSEFVALLNNDTVADPDWLAELVAAAADPAVGMCASRMLLMGEPALIDSAGIAVDRLGYAWGLAGGQNNTLVSFRHPTRYSVRAEAPHSTAEPCSTTSACSTRIFSPILRT